jgi:hypothetical protein
LNIKPKTDDDQMMGKMDDDKPIFKGNKTMGKVGRPINAEISWGDYLKNFSSVPREQIIDVLNNSLLQIKPLYNADVINHYTDAGNRESYLKTATIQIMSTPEYQMC